MEVMGIPVLSTVEDMLFELQSQLHQQNIELLKDVKPTHNNVMITCINHGGGVESAPSCGVSTVDVWRGKRLIPEGTVHCFACGYTASFEEFVSKALGYNDGGHKGYQWVMNNFASLSNNDGEEVKLPPLKPLKEVKQEIVYITEEELDQYRYTHPYMYERKLTDKVINYFDVGYDKNTNSLTFPVNDKDGNCLFVQRRSVVGKSFNNPSDAIKSLTIYGLDKVYKKLNRGETIPYILLCESIIDALYCWTVGICAIALLGTGNYDQYKILQELPVNVFYLGLDNDEAGAIGCKKLKKHVIGKIFYRIKFPRNVKDLNLFTQDELLTMDKKIYF